MIVVVLGAAAATALARSGLGLAAAAAEGRRLAAAGAPVGDAAVEHRPRLDARPPAARSLRPPRAGPTRRSSPAGGR